MRKEYFLGFLLSFLSATVLAAHLPDSIRVCDDLAVPIIASEKNISCAGQPVILRSSGCVGTVIWSNNKQGVNLTVYPTQTTRYTAYCKTETCRSKDSAPHTVVINIPRTPIVNASKRELCYGQTTTLTATGCADNEVIWSNGDKGASIEVKPYITTVYTATCKAADGCISCFANELEIKVYAAGTLAVVSTLGRACAGESVTLSAPTCNGTLKWPDGSLAKTYTATPLATTTYTAQCQSVSCGVSTGATIVEVGALAAPNVRASRRSTICKGESTTLIAEGCTGTVLWSDGSKAATLEARPTVTTTYTARCERGVCRSDASNAVVVTVAGNAPEAPRVTAELSNKCPFLTVDLSGAIKTPSTVGIVFEPRATNDPSSSIIEQSAAVYESGTYFIFAKNAEGCYSPPAAVKVTIRGCTNAIPICMAFTPTAEITTQLVSGKYLLMAELGGSASSGKWSSTGSGTLHFVDSTTAAYQPSVADYQVSTVTVSFKTNDPDGVGPCQPIIVSQEIKLKTPNVSQEVVGLSKKLYRIVKLPNKNLQIEYAFLLSNLGSSPLTNVTLIDSLDQIFKNGSVIVERPKVRIFEDIDQTKPSVWQADSSFTGSNGKYSLIEANATLDKGALVAVWLQVVIDASNARDSVVYNRAYIKAIDANGNVCKDVSTNGIDVDPDQDGDPSNNSMPTPTKISGGSEAVNMADLFIPEGFSPNGDGINDLFIIQKPLDLQLSLEVYNRWGGVVYQSKDYKNNWDGSTNQTKDSKQVLPVGTYFYKLIASDGREISKFLTINR
jgi:gliding motility-associated-like protein/uncharacterized repeat protein (TIGR01451 family)